MPLVMADRVLDAKRGKLFSKLSRAIIVAAKEDGGDPSGELDRRAEVVFRLLGAFDCVYVAGDEVGGRQGRRTPAPFGDGEYVGDEVGGPPGIARVRHGERGASRIPRRLEKVAVGTRQRGRFLVPRGADPRSPTSNATSARASSAQRVACGSRPNAASTAAVAAAVAPSTSPRSHAPVSAANRACGSKGESVAAAPATATSAHRNTSDWPRQSAYGRSADTSRRLASASRPTSQVCAARSSSMESVSRFSQSDSSGLRSPIAACSANATAH
jgi:hypothetical protein